MMATNNLKWSFFEKPKTLVAMLVALAALGTLLASSIGSALVERIGQEAAEDRLLFGTMTDTCIRRSCSPSHLRPD
jgi:hypothetical protein